MMKCPRPGVAGLLAVFFASSFGAASADTLTDRRAAIGMNLTGIGVLDAQWDFTNWGKTRLDFVEKSGGASFDAASDTATLPSGGRLGTWFTQGNPNAPTGTWTVTWQGTASGFSFTHDWERVGSVTKVGDTYTARVQTKPLDFKHRDFGRGFRLGIANNSGTTQTFTNLKAYAPGYGPGEARYGQTFHAEFEQRLQPFGTVRFMDWTRANDNADTSWSEANTPSSPTFNNKHGVPVEHMVELANRLDTDAWFTMPVKADDNYVRQFATYVKNNLEAGRKAYVEYGNEVWGFSLAQTHLKGLASGDTKYGKNADNWWQAWADEAKRDFAIWDEVFATGGDPRDRVVRVAAAQSGNRYHSPLFYKQMGEGSFDAISVAAYVSGSTNSYTATTRPEIMDQIFAGLFADIASQSDTSTTTATDWAGFFGSKAGVAASMPKGNWAFHKAIADKFGVPLIAYEGGQHVTPDGRTQWSNAAYAALQPTATQTLAEVQAEYAATHVRWYDSYVAAQSDPRMKEVYLQLLEAWLGTVGAEKFLAYSNVSAPDQFGAWGALQHQLQAVENAPKYAALMEYLGYPAPEPTAAMMGLGLAALALTRSRR